MAGFCLSVYEKRRILIFRSLAYVFRFLLPEPLLKVLAPLGKTLAIVPLGQE
jgi:hypothetical protein